MRASLEVELAGEVGANGLGGGLEAEGRGGGCKICGVLTSVALGLNGDVLLLGDQVVNALFKFHLYQLF